jgi:hypothetical protein
MAARPVYLLAGVGKVKLNKLREVTFDCFFPRAVVVVGAIHTGLSAVAKLSVYDRIRA